MDPSKIRCSLENIPTSLGKKVSPKNTKTAVHELLKSHLVNSIYWIFDLMIVVAHHRNDPTNTHLAGAFSATGHRKSIMLQ